MASTTIPIIDARVAAIYDIEAQIAALQAQRKALADELIKIGEGTYAESADPAARKAIVVVPTKYSTKYDLYNSAALKAFLADREVKKPTPALIAEFRALREEAAEAIAGETFKQLFDRVVSRVPTDGFQKLVPKLLTTAKGEPSAKCRELLLLCQVVTAPKDPHLKLPDKPKAGAPGESEDED